MSLPIYQTPMKGRQLSASEIAKLQRDVQSLCRPQAGGAGMTVQTSPFGNYLQDTRPDAFLAIIQADDSSSSDGIGSSGVASDQTNAYAWREATPMLANNDYILIEKPGGRYGKIDSRPAMEANRNTGVPIGTVVRLYPGTGQPDWYYFFWTGDSSSSSGAWCYEIDCSAGTIIVTDCSTSSTGSGTSGGSSSSGKGGSSSSGSSSSTTPKPSPGSGAGGGAFSPPSDPTGP
ncbi:MAG: hypothetical protein QM703_13630 [Gemmatales bacterium]